MSAHGVGRAARLVALVLAAACARGDGSASSARAAKAPPLPAQLGLGRAATPAEVAALDISVDPSGAGLPSGSGGVAQGAATYARACAACHGAAGEGIAPAPKLIGREPREGFPFGRDPKLVQTVGNYWPYATTLYDYIHRAMPLDRPGSLTPDEVYGVVAFLLARNEIVPDGTVMDARTLSAVRMPARGRFVRDDRKGGEGFR